MQKNDTYEVLITGYTNECQGVCRVNDMVVFVKNAVSGDFLKIKIIKVTKSIAYAIIVKIIEPSPHRIEAKCPVSSQCGGCSANNMTYEEELRFKLEKVNNCMQRLGKLDFSFEECIPSLNIERYRNKAQFPVSNINGKAVFGFYRKNSHDIVPCDDCLLQTEKSNKIAKFIVDFLNKNKIPAYSEEKHKGFIRHIYVRTGFVTGNIMVCIVTKDLKIPKIDTLSASLVENFPEITNVILNKNDKQTNQILGKEFAVSYGNMSLIDYLCQNKFEIEPAAFYQVNHSSAEKLYKKAIEFCDFTGNETVLELYSGIGTITLAVAPNVKKITGIEIVKEAIQNAKNSAKTNNITNADFIVSDAKDAVKQFENEKIDVIIVDPPRKGLDNDTINSIINISPSKIAYISCDPGTLARDVKILTENGYKIMSGVAVDLFPRTTHVECVVMMTRA